jgi:predicted kinase
VSRLILTRGLPACGKTTRARDWVAEDPTHRARVNRDDLRQMLHDGVYLGQDTERQIVAARDALIRSLLAKGLDVVCDETNLPQRVARDVARVGLLADPEITLEVWDMTDVPVETCVNRDVVRREQGRRSVGDRVIYDMHERFIRGRAHPLPFPDPESGDGETVLPYMPKFDTPRAVMVDIDGTVALHGARSPFDETRVHEDRPNKAVIAVVHSLWRDGNQIIMCSGRTEGCRGATEKWLNEWIGADSRRRLFMRPVGDTRKDAIVKREIFDREIRNHYDVVCVLDDRNQVVEMWRELGLTVLQVAPGDF